MTDYGPTPLESATQPLVTHVHGGETIDYTPTTAVACGAVVVQGSLVGVALRDIAAYSQGALHIEGSFLFPKAAGDGGMAAGVPAYWDESEQVATETALGNIYIGKVELAAATADTSVRIQMEAAANGASSTAVGSTNASSLVVDADATTPKIALASQTGGTGDYTTTIKPESTLSADNAIIVPEADGDTLVAVALAQTLTNKTLTSPTLTTPLIDDTDAGVTITSADQTNASAVATIPDIGDAADEFVMKDTAQTLTNKTLTSPAIAGLSKMGLTATPVAAAGSTVTDAGQLGSTNFTLISSDSAAKGVKLPTVAAGNWGVVINTSATAAEFYAASGGTVNGLSADASVVVPASKGLIWFATGADTVLAFDLTAAATAS